LSLVLISPIILRLVNSDIL